MLLTLAAVMFAINALVTHFVTINPVTTFFAGMGILLTIAYIVDKKEGRY